MLNTFDKPEVSMNYVLVDEGGLLVAGNFEDLVTDALNQSGKYLFGTWLPNHNLTTEPFSAEKYYRELKGMACMEIWVKPLPLENKR